MFLYKYQEEELKIKIFKEIEETKKLLHKEKVYKYYVRLNRLTKLYYRLFKVEINLKLNDQSFKKHTNK